MTWKYLSRSTESWEKGEYKCSPSFSSVQQTALAPASEEFGALLFHSGYSREPLNCCSSLLEGMGHHLLLLSSTCHRWGMQGPLHPQTGEVGTPYTCLPLKGWKYKSISRSLWLWHVGDGCDPCPESAAPAAPTCSQYPKSRVSSLFLGCCLCFYTHLWSWGAKGTSFPSEHCFFIPSRAAQGAYHREYLWKRRASCNIPQLPHPSVHTEALWTVRWSWAFVSIHK